MTTDQTPEPTAAELELREQLYGAMDGNLRMSRRRKLLNAYRDAILAAPPAVASAAAPPTQAALRDRTAEAVLRAVEAAMDDTLVSAAREEALAGIKAVLPAPVDRAAVLREAAEQLLASDLGPRPGHTEDYGCGWSDATLRAQSYLLGLAQDADGSRLAEAPQPETEARRCAHRDIVYGRCILPIPGHLDCFHEQQPIRADDQDEWGDGLCDSEYPGDENFAGHLCALPEGHFGDHRREESIAGTAYTIKLRWPAAAPAVVAQPGKENDRG